MKAKKRRNFDLETNNLKLSNIQDQLEYLREDFNEMKWNKRHRRPLFTKESATIFLIVLFVLLEGTKLFFLIEIFRSL